MKGRIIIYFLCIALGFASCKKDDSPAFEKSADERINESLTKYQTALVGADNGWKAFIYPKGGGTFFFYFKFDAQNRVKMYSTFDSASAVTLNESSYRLKALQQPSLIFDTYSYVHVLADPNENVGVFARINAGPVGVGLQSDFEFYFDSTYTDSITLVGRFNESRAVLIKATKQEADAYNNRELGRSLQFENINRYQNYFKRVTIGGVVYEIQVDPIGRTITLSWLGPGGVLQTFTTDYYYALTGVVFVNPLVNGSTTITGFNNLTWNANTTTLGFSVNGTATTVVGSGQPLRVDLNAPRRWWQYAIDNGGTYWISLNGFHVNGVDDAFNINSLMSGSNSYYYLIYWPEYNGSNNDFFGPIFINPAGTSLVLAYGTAPRPPTFTSDGRAIFVQLGNYGPHPTTGPAAQTRALLYQPNGFYFVQTGPQTYDMVNATDGKSWLTWEF